MIKTASVFLVVYRYPKELILYIIPLRNNTYGSIYKYVLHKLSLNAP